MRTISIHLIMVVVMGGLLAALSADLRADDFSTPGIVRIHNAAAIRSEPVESGTSCGCQQCSQKSKWTLGCLWGGNGCGQSSSLLGKLWSQLSDSSSCHGNHWFMLQQPIHRDPVEYTRYWPKKWYGQAGSGISAGVTSAFHFMNGISAATANRPQMRVAVANRLPPNRRSEGWFMVSPLSLETAELRKLSTIPVVIAHSHIAPNRHIA